MSLIYNLSNFKRTIERFVTNKVKTVLATGIVNNVYWVKYSVKIGNHTVNCVTFVSKRWLKWSFVQFRKLGSIGIEIEKINNTDWLATSGNNLHAIQIKNRYLRCSCEDFQSQVLEIGYGCCKHGYAVLNTLGYSSLRDFLDNSTTCS